MSSSSAKGKQPAHDHAHDDIDEDDLVWPVVTAEEIEDAMEMKEHFMDPKAGRVTACLSDMAGMQDTGLGVHRVTLPANTESTVLHTHLAESEWLYILSGEATLILARTNGDSEDMRSGQEGALETREVKLKTGDFAGFPAGNPHERWAHVLRAGEQEVTYLLGGDRKGVDVITYPASGKTLVCHEESAAEALFAGRQGDN